MDWQHAKDQTIQLWLQVRRSIGRAHQVDLLTDINLICPLCEQAMVDRSEAGASPSTSKCEYCPGYKQFGGCKEVCAEISTKIAERDWKSACEIADEFIDRLRRLRLPDEDAARGRWAE